MADENYLNFMMGSGGDEGYADMTGFRDDSNPWGPSGSGDFGLGDYSFDYLNPYSALYGFAPDGSLIQNNAAEIGEYGSNQWDMMDADGSGGSWLDTIGNWGGKALGWLGNKDARGNANWENLLGTGLGALAMYGNYQQGRDAQNMSADQLALARELGLGNLALKDREMGLNENQFRLDNGIDDMATKALGMQLLVNRGRMSSDQTNPWLNFMFTGREQMFGQDPVIGNAFKTNPFSGAPVGIENRRPSASQFFMPQDESSTLGRILRNVRPEEPSFAEGGPVNLAQRLQQRAQARLNQPTAPARTPDQVRQNMLLQQRSQARLNQPTQSQPSAGIMGSLDRYLLDTTNAAAQRPDVQIRNPDRIQLDQELQYQDVAPVQSQPMNLAQRLQQRTQTRLGAQPAAPARTPDQVRQNMRSFYGHVPDAPVQAGAGVTGGLDQLMRSRQPVNVQLRAPQVQQPVMPQVQQPVIPQVQQPVMPQVQQPAWDWRNSPDFQATLQDLSQRTPDSYDWGQSQGFAGGGLAALGYLAGGSTGQADDVNANLSHGEYVFDADVVAALGDGNSEAGARKLDEMRERIRRHKRSAPASKIPPQAKDPMKYLGGK